uniref:Zinc finger protein 470-like n=1 Tax=Diabrotica virgifera virgifera TaxID=50390 RepID=A0A6P7H2C4_DIAVI
MNVGIFLTEIKVENTETEVKDFSNKIHDSLDDTEKEKCSHNCTLTSNITVHTKEKTYNCEVCLKPFSQLPSLQRHMRIHTGEKPVTFHLPFTCNFCSKEFSQQGNLTTHLMVHTEEKPYNCEVCLKAFSRLSNMQRHMRIHTGEKPYQ